MKEVITKKDLIPLFELISKTMNEGKEELSRLDSLMGDGDLGITMSKGYAVIPVEMNQLQDEPMFKMIMKSGMKVSSVVPSTMGFLMSSGLMSAGKAIKPSEEIRSPEMAKFLQGFADGIVKRGKCELNDRTILDVIQPAATKAEKVLIENPNIELSELMILVDEQAKMSLENTKNLIPKFGKAAIHKEKAKDYVDQGALAGYYVIHAIKEFVN